MNHSYYLEIAEKIAASAQGAPMRDGEISPDFINFFCTMYTPEQARYVRLLEMDRQFLPRQPKNPVELYEILEWENK